MPVLGLGSNKKTKSTKKDDSKNNNDEAKELLKQMEAKKEAGYCPFC